MKISHRMLAMAAGILVTSTVQANIITYQFSGHITGISDNQSWLGNRISLGNTFSGSVSYMIGVAPSQLFDADPRINIYYAVINSFVNVNGYIWDATPNYPGQMLLPGHLQVWDNYGSSNNTDAISFSSQLDYAPPISVPVTGQLIGSFNLNLFDYTHSLLQSDAEPLNVIDISKWSYHGFHALEMESGTNNAIHLDGQIDSMTYVGMTSDPVRIPEPGVLSLLGLWPAIFACRRFTART